MYPSAICILVLYVSWEVSVPCINIITVKAIWQTSRLYQWCHHTLVFTHNMVSKHLFKLGQGTLHLHTYTTLLIIMKVGRVVEWRWGGGERSGVEVRGWKRWSQGGGWKRWSGSEGVWKKWSGGGRWKKWSGGGGEISGVEVGGGWKKWKCEVI